MLLETVTGRLVNVINPEPDQISIDDIAWGLSRIPRFAGHTISPVPYSVAQHSILVLNEVEEVFVDYNHADYKVQEAVRSLQQSSNDHDIFLKALLHDAAEVYIGDIPSPVKKHPAIAEEIEKIENRLMLCVYDAVGTAPPNNEEKIIIKWADMVARAIEAHAFMVSRGQNWEGLPHISLTKLQSFEQPWPAIDAYKKFLKEYHDLGYCYDD